MPAVRHVVLLGLMGSGKTSVGTRVAKRLDRPLVDGDERLEARTGGRTAADVANDEGLEALHRLEAEIAISALANATPTVIGPAASVIESDEVRELLANHTVVWLTAPAEYLAERAVGKDHRPLLDDGNPVALFRSQLAEREPLAIALAALVIDVSQVSKKEAADMIVDLARRDP